MTTTVTIEDERVRRMVRGVEEASDETRDPWREFTQYMRFKTDRTFARLRRGGTFRGVTWKPFAPQYTRKDGTVVPAWGGVPRVRTGRSARTKSGALRKGGRVATTRTKFVLGRLRPSGKRLTGASALLQDTMHVKKTATTVLRMTDNVLELGPTGTNYARAQQRGRPFLFFHLPKDLQQMVRIFADHLREGARRGGAR